MRKMLGPLNGFVVMTGPSPWCSTNISYHCGSEVVKEVLEIKVERRVLLFRDPVERARSLWEFSRCTWKDWCRDLRPAGHFIPQTHYCRDADYFIRTEHMVHDLQALFPGLGIEPKHLNKSRRDAVVDEATAEKFRHYYWEDVIVHELLSADFPVADQSSPSGEAEGGE